jgi:hypothetical protein
VTTEDIKEMKNYIENSNFEICKRFVERKCYVELVNMDAVVDEVAIQIDNVYRGDAFYSYMNIIVDDMDEYRKVFEERLEIIQIIKEKLNRIEETPIYTEDPDALPMPSSEDFKGFIFRNVEILTVRGWMKYWEPWKNQLIKRTKSWNGNVMKKKK